MFEVELTDHIHQLEAIKQTKVNMSVWLGNYPIPTDPTPYERQRDAIIDAIKTYGTDHVAGVTVGNEYILKFVFSISSWPLVPGR